LFHLLYPPDSQRVKLTSPPSLLSSSSPSFFVLTQTKDIILNLETAANRKSRDRREIPKAVKQYGQLKQGHVDVLVRSLPSRVASRRSTILSITTLNTIISLLPLHSELIPTLNPST